MNKKVIIWGVVIVAGVIIYNEWSKKQEQIRLAGTGKSNIGGTGTNTLGPCSGSMATPENCKKACEEGLGGSYDGSSRMCTGAINGGGNRLFGTSVKYKR